jgi:hypothetical protein
LSLVVSFDRCISSLLLQLIHPSPNMRSTFLIAAASIGSGLASAQCQVYGIDIQNGGTYFENVDLTVPFTLVQEFSGCDNDTANV